MDSRRAPSEPYFHRVTMENRLYESLNLHYSVVKAEWDEEGNIWKSEYTIGRVDTSQSFYVLTVSTEYGDESTSITEETDELELQTKFPVKVS